MDIIIQQTSTICAHIIIIRKGTQTVTQTHGHTDKQSDKRIVDSHTQTKYLCVTVYNALVRLLVCMSWAIHCTDWLTRQAHCRQSHTDICLERFTVLTDWLHATCVNYSKSRINDIYTEVISFFSVVIDTYRNQFLVNVDSSPLMFDLFVSILYLIVSCWRKQERVAEHFVFVYVSKCSLYTFYNNPAPVNRSTTISLLYW